MKLDAARIATTPVNLSGLVFRMLSSFEPDAGRKRSRVKRFKAHGTAR